MFGISRIARVAYEVNRAYRKAIGEVARPAWESAGRPVQAGYEAAVERRLGSMLTPEEQHWAWMQAKLDDGWRFGPFEDPDQKTSPYLLPFSELPREQRVKDALFCSVVDTLAKA